MQAFHNDAKIKQFYVDRLKEHQRLDQLIAGTGWDGEKGCNVGCILHEYDHGRYPEALGLPEWYAHLCDTLFEGLPKEKRADFALASLTSIKEGCDIEPVKWKLAILRNKKMLDLTAGNEEDYAVQCRKSIQHIIDYCESELRGCRDLEAKADVEDAAKSAAEVAFLVADRAALNATVAAAAAVGAPCAVGASAMAAAHATISWTAGALGRAAVPYYVWEAETLIQLLTEVN